MNMIEREKFLQLPSSEIAEIVRAADSQVCVLPIKGIRRWLILEHGQNILTEPAESYLDLIGKSQIELYTLCFEHGLDTLVTPIFGNELLDRGRCEGDRYRQALCRQRARRLGRQGRDRPRPCVAGEFRHHRGGLAHDAYDSDGARWQHRHRNRYIAAIPG